MTRSTTALNYVGWKMLLKILNINFIYLISFTKILFTQDWKATKIASPFSSIPKKMLKQKQSKKSTE